MNRLSFGSRAFGAIRSYTNDVAREAENCQAASMVKTAPAE
jgi:hypothetical protein